MRACRASSFMLIEVLVALGLGALLTVGIQALLVHVHRTSVELELHQQAAARRELPFVLLGHDLDALLTAGDVTLIENTLRLTTVNSLQASRLAARHPVSVRYAIARDGNALALTRTEAEVTAPMPAGGVRVGRDLAAMHLAIFDGRDWQTAWPLATPRPAQALRISIEFADHSRNERIYPLAPRQWRHHRG